MTPATMTNATTTTTLAELIELEKKIGTGETVRDDHNFYENTFEPALFEVFNYTHWIDETRENRMIMLELLLQYAGYNDASWQNRVVGTLVKPYSV